MTDMGQIDTAYLPHERRFSVYMHITPNSKRYIGITGRSVNARWHPKNYEDCRAFYKAIQKYGWDSITHHIISVGLTKEEAKNAERFLIEKYRTTDKRFGYNILKGGDISDGISEEGRKRLSEFNKGKIVSEETKKKQRESLIRSGHTRTVVCYETGERFDSVAAAGRTHGIKGASILSVLDKPERTCGGKHWVSIENLDGYTPAQSKSELKKRKVEIVETGKTFESVAEAAQYLGINPSVITNACKGRNRTTCGYHLKYLEDPLPDDIDIGKYEFVKKKILLVETNHIYESVADASRELGIKTELIINVCKGRQESTHGLHFHYIAIGKQKPLKNSAYRKVANPQQGIKKRVECLETGIVYDSMNLASKATGIQRKSITKACEDQNSTAGKYHWKYVVSTRGVM